MRFVFNAVWFVQVIVLEIKGQKRSKKERVSVVMNKEKLYGHYLNNFELIMKGFFSVRLFM